MDINENMKLDDFEMIISNVSEGVIQDVPVESINEEMVLKSINKQFDNNRTITMGVDLSILDLLRNELDQYTQKSVRGK